MTRAVDLAALTPQQRAATILSSARADLSGRLWRAALGSLSDEDAPPPWSPALPGSERAATDMDALLAALTQVPTPKPAVVEPTGGSAIVTSPKALSEANAPPTRAMALPDANRHYVPALDDASRRTGIPASALAAIIDAEAGRGAKGGWNVLSRNPRSSAAGLGQFLSSTWMGLARTPGTWLNREARVRGLVDGEGQLAEQARGALLAMRYDPKAAIETVADYARANLDRLRERGVTIGTDATAIARAAYIGHHLGAGDALRFYNGTLGEARARILLTAQIGGDKAAQRTLSAGNATAAHRTWLFGHIDRNVRPERYDAGKLQDKYSYL